MLGKYTGKLFSQSLSIHCLLYEHTRNYVLMHWFFNLHYTTIPWIAILFKMKLCSSYWHTRHQQSKALQTNLCRIRRQTRLEVLKLISLQLIFLLSTFGLLKLMSKFSGFFSLRLFHLKCIWKYNKNWSYNLTCLSPVFPVSIHVFS